MYALFSLVESFILFCIFYSHSRSYTRTTEINPFDLIGVGSDMLLIDFFLFAVLVVIVALDIRDRKMKVMNLVFLIANIILYRATILNADYTDDGSDNSIFHFYLFKDWTILIVSVGSILTSFYLLFTKRIKF